MTWLVGLQRTPSGASVITRTIDVPHALQQHVCCKVAIQLIASLAYVLKHEQHLLKLHARKQLTDVVDRILQICLCLKRPRGIYVARQTLQLCKQQHLIARKLSDSGDIVLAGRGDDFV